MDKISKFRCGEQVVITDELLSFRHSASGGMIIAIEMEETEVDEFIFNYKIQSSDLDPFWIWEEYLE